jgi:hypothetical protein
VNGQNQRRAQTNSISGLIGVGFNASKAHLAKPWDARIMLNGEKIHIGYFASAEDAHQAYLSVKRAMHQGCTI